MNGTQRPFFRRFRAAAAFATMLLVATTGAAAQEPQNSPPPPPAPASNGAPLVRVDAQNADVRSLLLGLFQQARVTNYTLAEDVAGTITIRLTDKPLDDALTLIARNASLPLAWSKTDGVYTVKRRVAPPRAADPGPNPLSAPDPVVTSGGARYDMVYPVYLDGEALVRAIELLQPAGVTAAIAYLPTNGVLVRFGGNGPLVTGVIGGVGVGPGGGNPGSSNGAGNNTNNNANNNANVGNNSGGRGR